MDHSTQSLKSRINVAEVLLFCTLLACYIYVFPRWADPNQNSRLDMVIAVVEDGTFQIDPYVANTVDYAKVGDHYYSDKAPGAAFLGIPLYAGLSLILDSPIAEILTDRLAGSATFNATLRTEGSGINTDKVRFALAQVLLAWMVSALPTALLGVLLFRILGAFTSVTWHRVVIVLAYGLLTPAFAYAGAFYGHQLSAALLFAALYLGFTAPPRPCYRRLLLIGALLGYSVVTEYPTLLMVGPIYLYIGYELYRRGQVQRLGWVTLAGSVVALGWFVYNTLVFGGPLELGYSHSELWVDQHHTGFMSLTLPHWDAIWGITFSRFRGLFLLSPWMLLAVPGTVIWWRTGEHRALWWTSTACILAMFLFNSTSSMWWGGYAVGPRYLLPMLPFMTLPVVYVLRQWGTQTWFRLLMWLTLIWSLFATWGLTLAEQAFPPDTVADPLLAYAWPHWQAGNIARNIGTLWGLRGAWSLLPLFIGFLILSAVGFLWTAHRMDAIKTGAVQTNTATLGSSHLEPLRE